MLAGLCVKQSPQELKNPDFSAALWLWMMNLTELSPLSYFSDMTLPEKAQEDT